MPDFPLIRSQPELHGFTAGLLRQWIPDFDQGKVRLRVPKRLGLMKDAPGMPYHLTPELFFQVSGVTAFEFPSEEFVLAPGEICLVPEGIPHREKARARGETPFLNLVFGYQVDFFHFHAAREGEGGVPQGFLAGHLSGVDLPPLIEHLRSTAQWFHREDADWHLAVKSILLAHLFTILEALERPSTIDCHKVQLIEGMLAAHLGNPSLSVEWIARNLQASPDYVSRLFRKARGKPLAASIMEQRLLRAKHLLATSSLNISEISQAVGYENPDCFTKLFRRVHGMPPRQYRETHARL